MHYQPTDTHLEQALQQAFDVSAAAAGWRMATDEILAILVVYGMQLSTSDRAQTMQLARVLIRLGVRRARTSHWRGYEGIRPKSLYSP